MNCEQANAVPISEILQKLNFKPSREDETDAYYLAPWRDERTASLHVNKRENVWFDHGLNKGGNTVAFVQRWLRSPGADDTVHDVLRWLPNMGFVNDIANKRPTKNVVRVSAWKLLREQPLEDLALIRYLENRGIDFWLAEKHICEVFVKSTKNNTKLYAIGFRNENGGYELRNPFLKSCLSPKTITLIRGSKPKPDGVHIFEGFMDFLTFYTMMQGRHDHDIIVLNSVNCVADAQAYMKGYGYKQAFTWMDNDKAGRVANDQLADFFKDEGIDHKPMNNQYKAHKDLNAAHVHKLTMK